jgi:hypothetical protein
MCPQCYLTALMFAMFGTYASFVYENTYVIVLGVGLIALGGLWLWKGYKKSSGSGGLVKNVGITVVITCVFFLGYLTASWQTHSYFEENGVFLKSVSEENHNH